MGRGSAPDLFLVLERRQRDTRLGYLLTASGGRDACLDLLFLGGGLGIAGSYVAFWIVDPEVLALGCLCLWVEGLMTLGLLVPPV